MQNSRVPPAPLFVAGLLTIILLVLQENIFLLILQATFCAVWASCVGKKIKILYFILLTVSVTCFNLLSPNGDVLFRVFRFPVTGGALLFGFKKGVLVCSFVFCSLATIRADMRLPSKIGATLAYVFVYYENLFQQRRKIRRKHLMHDIDALLVDLLQQRVAIQKPRRAFQRAAWVSALGKAGIFLGFNCLCFAISMLI